MKIEHTSSNFINPETVIITLSPEDIEALIDYDTPTKELCLRPGVPSLRVIVQQGDDSA